MSKYGNKYKYLSKKKKRAKYDDNFSVPPTFVDEQSSPSHVAVQEGSDVELICVAEGVPTPSITWNREDNRPLSGNRGVLKKV